MHPLAESLRDGGIEHFILSRCGPRPVGAACLRT
jgi:hypothetical protein